MDKKDEFDLFLDSYLIVNGNKNLWYRTYTYEDCKTYYLDNIILSK